MKTQADRIAEALRETRPESDDPGLRQWGDIVVAIAAALAELDPAFNLGAFFTACGGL